MRANDLQFCCESAEHILGRFEQASKILALFGLTCAYAACHLGLTKFLTIFFADLTRANDSQGCCESAELFWGPIQTSQ